MELVSLKINYALDEPYHKVDFLRYSPNSLATIKKKIIQIF